MANLKDQLYYVDRLTICHMDIAVSSTTYD